MPRVVIRRASDLGLALAAARRGRGMSQVELADAAGVDRSYLARLESGLSTILVERLLRLLRRLGAELVVVLPAEQGPTDPPEAAS